MKKIFVDSEYFSPIDTLNCGQIFRFKEFNKGFIVLSSDKACYLHVENGKTCIECEEKDEEYFYNYFDLDRDYSSIYLDACKQNFFLKKCATLGKGVRILNQDKIEMLFSFIVSQNNNIPRIKLILERLAKKFGNKKSFLGEEYYTFPNSEIMAKYETKVFLELGLGYRAEYVRRLAESIKNGLDINSFSSLSTEELKKNLLSIYGVGPKVADCVSLFGFHRVDSFPVDTWIEKVYLENYNGKLKDRSKISKWFVDKYGENSGFFQQYMFYYKRSLENNK